MFYDRFLKLCQERNIAPSRAATEAGLSKSTVSKWKNEPSSEPSGSVLKKLSEYFGIGVSEILDEKPVDSSPAVIMGFGGPGQITVPDKKKIGQESGALTAARRPVRRTDQRFNSGSAVDEIELAFLTILRCMRIPLK